MPSPFSVNLAGQHPAAVAVAAAGYTVTGVLEVGAVTWVYIDWPLYRGKPQATPGVRADDIPGYTGQFGHEGKRGYLVIRSEG